MCTAGSATTTITYWTCRQRRKMSCRQSRPSYRFQTQTLTHMLIQCSKSSHWHLWSIHFSLLVLLGFAGCLGRGGTEFGGISPDSLQSPAAEKPAAGPQEGGWSGGVCYCRWAQQWHLGIVSPLTVETVEFIDEVMKSRKRCMQNFNTSSERFSILHKSNSNGTSDTVRHITVWSHWIIF